MTFSPRHAAAIACACAGVAVVVLGVRSYSGPSSFAFRHHGLQWEIVIHRGSIRLDNQPELNFEQRDLSRLERIVDARAREYLGTMLDGPSLESRTPMELSQAARGVAASRSYGQAKLELARWRQIYTTKPVSHALHLGVPIAALLLPPLWRARAMLRRRGRARKGLCVACGYDMRATAERCPECGRAVAVPSRPNDESAETPVPGFVPPFPMR